MPYVYDIKLKVVNGVIKKYLGTVEFPGTPPPLQHGDKLNFHCDQPASAPFALFLTGYQSVTFPAPQRGRFSRPRIRAARLAFAPPFAPPGLVYASDANGDIKLQVTPNPPPGTYTYVLAVNDGGTIVTLDPQIIIN